jgi:DNA polymerase III sliding clamp (beta) subunit (PCNA family)
METLHFKGQYDPMFKVFSFLYAATHKDKDCTKEQLAYIFYEAKKKRLWSTDGFRLHIINMDMGKKDRIFRTILKKKNEMELIDLDKDTIANIHKPNISLVLLDIRAIAKQSVSFTKRKEVAYVRFMRLFNKTIIQQDFFNDLQLYSDTWQALLQEEEKGQCFKCEHALAVIMPLNIDKQ